MTAKTNLSNKQKQRRKTEAKAGLGTSETLDLGFQIAVLDRGFVYIGDVKTDSEWCVISGARNIRRWGTTKGLGQLALEGPQADTTLDDTGTVRAPMRAVIALISCDKRKWK